MALTSTVRFRPFSHELNTFALIPGTTLAARVTPCHAALYDYDAAEPKVIGKIAYPPIRPLEEFSVTLDLEKGCLLVSSRAFRLEIAKGVSIRTNSPDVTVEGIVLSERGEWKLQRERLTLGIDKAQEWPRVARRGQMAEILPFWYYLSQSISAPAKSGSFQGPSLLSNAYAASEEVLEPLKVLFQAGFTDLLLPVLEDRRDLGFELPIVANPHMSPLHLLHATRPLIRRLFFQENEAGLHFLPLVPAAFHSGTLSPIFTAKGHTLLLEWTKGSIRRLLITAAQDDVIPLHFEKQITRFRLRQSKEERGGHILANGANLELRQNRSYLLDNFE